MMLLIETSGVLRALLENDVALLRAMDGSERFITSELTILEGYRNIDGAFEAGRLTARGLTHCKRWFEKLEGGDIVPISGEILARARNRMPAEPVRSLDAIHLATAFILNEKLGPTPILTCDRRIRANARAVGIPVLPA